jgi:acetyl-CoA carboxylase biotin carboxylase subunit
MFRKILIANRGEIALRILWACKDLGIRTVAVHSEADADALHVKFADEDICIGPAPNTESYLNMSSIIAAAEITDADAIHPGYGFLAESAHFAEVSEACGITFIGPSPEIIRQMGDKSEARTLMKASGVPVLPGSDGPAGSAEEALGVANEVGYPVIVKASAGGGGRGMRVARDDEELLRYFEVARQEAKAAFDSAEVYVEKFLQSTRHIEFRKKMAEAALAAGSAVSYYSAGTVEFLLDPITEDFYFIEMNTRIQVEHPVTEMVTGVDLVKEQIRVAAGERLSIRPEDAIPRGHSIECRINAEDPETFTPCPGEITSFNVPGGPGIRLDTAAYAEYRVPPYYDSMIAKLITHGNDREEAVARMQRCLDLIVVEGIKTNVALHARILSDPEFRAGRISTAFLDGYFSRQDLAREGKA